MDMNRKNANIESRWVRLLAAVLTGLIFSACTVDDDDDDSATPDPALENAFSYPGDYALQLLRADPYSKLVIEVDVMEGALATDDAENAFYDALDTLVEYVDFLCNKPDGIELLDIQTIPAPADKTEFTLDDINDLEAQYRDTYWDDSTMALYFLYVNGHSDYDNEEENTAIVGYAYHGTSMAIFMETVNSKAVPLRPVLLKTVTVHEFGHQLGLVDNGVPMQVPHDDPEHPPHCDNSKCMMYWLNNGISLVANLINNEIPDFDDNCLADIAAAGGKDGRGLTQPN